MDERPVTAEIDVSNDGIYLLILVTVFPHLCDERGGLFRCFSKPPPSKYARIATSELFLAINMLLHCSYAFVFSQFPRGFVNLTFSNCSHLCWPNDRYCYQCLPCVNPIDSKTNYVKLQQTYLKCIMGSLNSKDDVPLFL